MQTEGNRKSGKKSVRPFAQVEHRSILLQEYDVVVALSEFHIRAVVNHHLQTHWIRISFLQKTTGFGRLDFLDESSTPTSSTDGSISSSTETLHLLHKKFGDRRPSRVTFQLITCKSEIASHQIRSTKNHLHSASVHHPVSTFQFWNSSYIFPGILIRENIRR